MTDPLPFEVFANFGLDQVHVMQAYSMRHSFQNCNQPLSQPNSQSSTIFREHMEDSLRVQMESITSADPEETRQSTRSSLGSSLKVSDISMRAF